MSGSIQAWSTIASAFLASSVEAVEALTVVLAVGVVRGWRSALLGTLAALVLLALLVAVISFAWLTWQILTAAGQEDEAPAKAMGRAASAFR